MSLPMVIQRRPHQAGFIRRHVSSTASKVKSHRTLASPKMRALISLYHQSDAFVTPETLSQRIDDAFVHNRRPGISHPPGESLRDFAQALSDLRKKPKLRDWNREGTVSRATRATEVNSVWSSFKAGREWKVIEALYGVDVTPSREVLPGLEVLEESVQPPRQHIDDDWEAVKREALGKTGRKS
jgi:hypothetical protein